MSMIYKTGNFLNLKTWMQERQSGHYVWLRLLEWSRDTKNELGVMYPTETLERVKVRANGLYKKPYGTFRKSTENPTVKSTLQPKP